MNRRMIVIAFFVLFAVSLPVHSAENKCVPSDVIIKTLEYAVSQMYDNPAVGVIAYTSECDPCKCPVGGMSDCYLFMAKREREKEDRHKNINDILDRAKKYGICK